MISVPEYSNDLYPFLVHGAHKFIQWKSEILFPSRKNPGLKEIPLKPDPDKAYIIFLQLHREISAENPGEISLLRITQIRVRYRSYVAGFSVAFLSEI